MATGNDNNALLHLLRGLLNKDAVKLWLEPYTRPDGTKGEEPMELIQKYAEQLKSPVEEVTSLLEQLRCHALEKLNAQKKLKESGELKLRVKLSVKNGADFSIVTSVTSTGKQLKSLIGEQCSVADKLLKLICQGKIVDDERNLKEQGIKVNSQILAVCLVTSEQSSRDRDTEQKEVEWIREAAEILADKRDDRGGTEDEYYLQVADQSGKPLELPKVERRALTLAMTLHEKGRAFMKRKNYSLGLLLLTEADEKFRQCRSAILDAVDNYGLLCLDIVWAYLCLRNLDHLPDAQQKLNKCQECLDKSYGSDLQRVASLKGTSSSESAIYVRLHLLQAIVAYHQHKLEQAQLLLAQTQREIQSLSVDDGLITQVVGLGFTPREARVGLRACQGQVDAAINQIIRTREEKEELRKKEKQERKKKKLTRKLGKTAKGQWVNTNLYESLIQMGFSAGAAAESLKQSDNDITLALQVLQEQPELLDLPDPGDFRPTDEQIAQMLSMGFDRETALATLARFHGNVRKALDDISTSMVGSETSLAVAGGSGSEAAELVKKTAEQLEREAAAVEAIVDDIPSEEDEYLDLTFDEEVQYLEEYSRLLSMSERHVIR